MWSENRWRDVLPTEWIWWETSTSQVSLATIYGQHSLLRWDPANCHATWWTLDSLASNRLLDPFLACFSKASSLARQRIVISTGLHHGASDCLSQGASQIYRIRRVVPRPFLSEVCVATHQAHNAVCWSFNTAVLAVRGGARDDADAHVARK